MYVRNVGITLSVWITLVSFRFVEETRKGIRSVVGGCVSKENSAEMKRYAKHY
jgi:hypothetical protein